MKIGMRKPSLKKSISARTTGRAKRAIKKAVIPGYGKKGMGWIKNPKKAAYNKVYHKTTFGVNDVIRAASNGSSHKTEKAVKNNSSIKNKKNIYCNSDVITEENVKLFEKVHDLDTSARLTPFIFLVASIICIFSTVVVLVIIGLVLDIITLLCLCRKSYWTAHRYRQAVLAYLQEDYDKCRKYLEKICDKEKEKDCYKEFISLVDEKTLMNNDDSTFFESEEESAAGCDDKCSKEEDKENDDNDEINSEEELALYNEVKKILQENRRDLTRFYMKHTGVYCDLCVGSEVFLRIKLSGRKHYILANLSDEEINRLNVNVDKPSKAEKYRVRVNLDSDDVVRKLTTYIIQEFDNCSGSN